MTKSTIRRVEQSESHTSLQGVSVGLNGVRLDAYVSSSEQRHPEMVSRRYFDRGGQEFGMPAGKEMLPKITFYDHDGHIMPKPQK